MALPETLLEGKYEILNKMREGGMGTIYRVRHRLLDQVRVIKVMRAHVIADEDLRRRFVDEARTTTRLNHPNICTIHDFALDPDGTGYLVMEYIEGLNLSEFLALSGRPALPLSLEIAHQALLALAYLHGKGIVHRDIAPDNFMLTRDEKGRPLVKLIDLGIAKVTDRTTEKTATGVFLGKLKYASPEQYGTLSSGETLDGRSDLYGLGVVLYEILTGVRPFSGETPGELLRAHLFAPPLPFSESDPSDSVPPELRRVILKALEKKREDRFSSAEAFDREIVALQHRFRGPHDLEATVAALDAIPRLDRFSRDHVTPSAQSRLDRQFAPSETPRPSSSNVTVMPTVSSGGRVSPTATTSEVLPPVRPRPTRAAVIGVVLLLAAAGAFLVLRGRSPRVPGRDASLPPPGAFPTAAPRPLGSPPPAGGARSAALEPSPEEAKAPEPSAAPAEEEPTPPPTRPPRPATTASSSARRRPEPVRAPVVAPPAARLEAQPASPAVEIAPPRPTPAPTRVAGLAAIEKDTGPPAAPAPPSRPAPAVSEQDRIRETVRGYERAQSTLDADLYVRVFPSVDRERIQRAFENFRSQSVEFTVRRIQIDPSGTEADVYGYEKRLAVPRAGSEQRMDAERMMHLQKRGDAWVITRIQ